MADLVEFLRARLDEDERKAREAKADGGPEWMDNGGAVYVRDSNDPVCVGPWTGYIADGERGHIAEHDPRRVLAEVDAKRRILDACQHHESPDTFDLIDDVLRLLALPYASHPDYQEEWRP